ncbi:hypothetical protein N1851_008532 [Merluccius polli]|uniref:Integrase catalytic domain-containing protein n=1 Tax=Merluccius polli TaxID=89951 RepID=A0AA47N274_MERPO|nr:hypothetical protein N1851_008532 [Merluccius polli]
MNKALNWPTIKPEDGNGLRSYDLFLQSCYHTMHDVDGLKELDSSTNLRIIVSKLPFRLRDRWRANVCRMQDHNQHKATFKNLVDFIEGQSRAMLDPIFGDIHNSTESSKVAARPKSQKPFTKSSGRTSFATTVDQPPEMKKNESQYGHKLNTAVEKPCLFCERNHAFEECEKFKSKPNGEKIEFLKSNGMCFGCLSKGHVSKTCRNRMKCETCLLSHPTILHIHPGKGKDGIKDDRVITGNKPLSSAMVSVKDDDLMRVSQSKQCTLAIVPVKVKVSNSDKVINTHAFLDPGSSATFCTDSLKRKLNISGKNTTILLCTMGQEKNVHSSIVSGLEVSNMEGLLYHKLPETYTQTKLPVSKQHIPTQESINKWKYLREVKIPQLDADIELLIGTNAANLMEPWKVINSRGNGPYAVRTPLGWVINGLMQETTCQMQGSHSCTVVNRISVANLNDLLIKQYHQDFPELAAEEKSEMSVEDKQFMSMMESSKEHRNGHYYLPLPFKEDNVMMPNNYQQAQQRITSLKRKLENNEQYRVEYTAFLEGMIEKGHAEVVPSDELETQRGKVWYIPHHGVHHPKKGSLRVVFDCSASFQGTSLNSRLIQGPNLTSNLVGVLLRFRQEPIALMADVEGMFHQVRVMEEHVDFFRFLWWPNGDTGQPLKEHRMVVHLFGATSSPSCASFALRQTAEDFRDLFLPETVQTIKQDFYVDDCLKSVATEADAVTLCKELERACSMGGFRLHKWISNSRTVLMSIPQAARAKEVKDLDLESSDLPTERTLGIQWHIERDKTHFRIYDPLGFISPFVLTAKNILQDLCKQNYAWDRDLPDHYTQLWQEWMAGLSCIGELSVNRCLKPKTFGAITSAQLHHFSDASESGYGCVTYLRLTNSDLEVHTSFCSESEWTNSNIAIQTDDEDDDDVEVKKDVLITNLIVKEEQNPTHTFIHYHSNWNSLTRAVAWLLKLKDILLQLSQKRKEILTNMEMKDSNAEKQCLVEREMQTVKKRMNIQQITLEDVKRAENAIVRFAQTEAFPEEMNTLQKKNAHVSNQSHIRKLDPILQDGLLRTGGRLSRMAMPEGQKHPVVLPKYHHVSKLALKQIHAQLGHCGRNHMLAKLRQQYWIPAANSLARKIRSECVFCRRLHSNLGQQKMADLPKERITPDLPPFTFVGADFFGPIIVKRGRSEVKRYGVIFTCFTTRAVHLEIANSLDTDSCINAIRRFISRRGQVQQIRSDNGTNLTSADRELKNAIKEWNQSNKLQVVLQQKGITWIYNPPAASHFGGVWERLIKQVKQALLSLTKDQILDDESLHTFICEVEAIMNSRPLTMNSDSPNDLEPLTPNHLLLLKGQPILPPGLFQKSDMYSRRRWKQVQYLADIFWKRWVREYLPNLQERQKWLKQKRNYANGDIVLIADPTAPRGSWMLGRVVDTKKDSKGIVRSLTLKTKTSVIDRPITKVCLLLENDM